jgi:hypothetical protein
MDADSQPRAEAGVREATPILHRETNWRNLDQSFRGVKCVRFAHIWQTLAGQTHEASACDRNNRHYVNS